MKVVDEEKVDVVNQKDEVLFQTSKEEAHVNGLLHRTVIAELIDSDGRWTLVKQASDRQDAGRYVSPVGGHVKAGESEVNALIREAKEEINLENFKYELVGKSVFNREVIGRKENHLFVVYEIFSDKIPKLNKESESFQKFSKYEIREELKNNPLFFGDAFHFVWNTFYSRKNDR